MKSKFQLITELYTQTLLGLSGKTETWTGFLKAAAYNYKCPFDEQVLIYAQKPEATAVLETKRWNRQFGRWINQGAKGISVFAEEHGKLKHYFDIADTRETERSRPVPLWEMEEGFTGAVIGRLEGIFGKLSDKETLVDAVCSAAGNAVSEYEADYLADLKNCVSESFLEELDALNLAVEFRKTTQNSVSYMMLTRLGVNADAYFDREDFRFVHEFNTLPTINILGVATGDIAELGLREISRAVTERQKSFAKNPSLGYDKDRKNEERQGTEQDERSANHGSDLQTGGRLSVAEPHAAAGAGLTSGEIRPHETGVYKDQTERAVHQPQNDLQAERTPLRNRTGSVASDARADRRHGEGGGRNGAAQSRGPDEVGGADEQFPALGGGNRARRADLQISDEKAGSDALPAFLNESLMEAIVLDEGGKIVKRQEIFEQFQAHKGNEERCKFLKNAYKSTPTECLVNGERVGYMRQEDGLLMWQGAYRSRTSESVFSWGMITELTETLMERGEYRIKLGQQNLKTVVEQLSLFGMVQKEPVLTESPSVFQTRELPQAVMEKALYTGGNETQSAARIAAHFMRAYPAEETVAFLKREFGENNGRGIEHEGRKYAVWFTADGITLAEGDSVRRGANRNTLSYEDCTQRILELLQDGHYLSQSEMASAYDTALKECANSLLLTARDLSHEGMEQGYFSKTLAIYEEHRSFPACADNLAEYMQTEQGLVPIAEEYDEFLTAYAADKAISRFGIYPYNAHRISNILDGVRYPKREFPTDETFVRQCKLFITQDEIDQFFLGGSADSNLAVYSHFCYSHTPEERQKFIQSNFGEYSGGAYGNYSHTKTHKGLVYEREYAFKKYDTVRLTIPHVVKQYERLIAQKRFPGEDAIAYIPAYEAEQLARQIYHGFSNAPQETARPYPSGSDFYSGVPIIQEQLSDATKVQEMLEALTALLDSTDEDDRYHDQRKKAKELLSEYVSGTFSLFNHRHDGLRLQPELESDFVRQVEADVAGITADVPAPYERFHVIETDTGYGVWDDIREEMYVDAEGVAEDFDSEWQSEAYLEQVKKAVSDKESAEWLYVEQAKNAPPEPQPVQTDEQFAAENLIPGETTFEIDGRIFLVDRVNLEHGTVNFQDITFVQNVGFPIFRTEPISFVRALVEQQEQTPTQEIPLPPVPRKKEHTDAAVPLDQGGINYRITDDALGVGAPSERYANNVAAIRLLHEIESENRSATADEQGVLAQYVGWGGLADCFDPKNSHYEELKSILSDTEYAAARESTLTAFYTPPVVIKSIYEAIERMGFTTGNLCDPACGTGNFLGLLPASMQASQLFGVELDSISGRIARQLYPKATLAVQGFEKTDFSDNFFDVCVGNVPFGQFKVPDKRYDKYNFSIHDYFFARSLDKVRPGGVVAFVTSSFTMDKKNPAVRKYLAQRAELLGAIRLPNNVFKAAAGTEVVSDILFLQKRDRMVDIAPEWVHLATDDNGIQMNSYFAGHPDMILGEMKLVSGPYGQEPTCVPYEGKRLEDLLSNAMQNIHAEITDYDRTEALDGEETSIVADPSVRNFSYAIRNEKIYYRENSRMHLVEVGKTADSRIRGQIQLRDCVRTLIEYQTEDYPETDIQAQQHQLNTLYDAFTKEHGLISSRANAAVFEKDSSYFLLCSLEIVGENGELIRKADLFSKRTIRAHKPVDKVDTASEALALSIGEKAIVDMAYMGKLTGKTEEALYADLKGVVFLNPNFTEDNAAVKYLPADEYLSGNVREKLSFAKCKENAEPGRFAVHVESLERVQPVDLTASEINVRLGATWINPDYIRQFTFALLETPRYVQYGMNVQYSKLTGEWRIEGKSKDRGNVKANSTYGTGRINAYAILEESLNLKDVRIFDYSVDADGKRVATLNKKETAIAQSKQELIKSKFSEWIWKDPERRERLCQAYNQLYNSSRPREYDGSHISFPGMNPEITLRRHQKNAIAHVLYGGNTLLAHCVGAGKSFEMIAAAMESKRLGLCQKSLFVVPNHLTQQMASEFLQLYPAANLLVATKKDFETKNRKKFCGRIATGEYDAVIIGHSQFEKIPMSVERQEVILQRQLDELLLGIEEAKRSRAENFTVKQMEKTRKGLEQKIAKLNDQSRKDDIVTFEELGVDRLFIDESHNFKNLFLYTKMRNVGGIAQTEAQKSSDLFMKCRYLDELTGGHGIVFATGTPISNSMVELYTIQRYLQHDTLQSHGLQHFDSWAATFGETVTAIELAPEGTGYRAKTRFAKFYNLPELMTMFKDVADIQTADMLKLPVPEVQYHNVVVKPSAYQKKMVESLSERADKVRRKEVDSSVDNMLLITNDGRKLALDQRLLNPMLPDEGQSKTAVCAENVFAIWQKTTPKKSAQMIFCDLSTPKDDGSFHVYDDIKRKLTGKGIPESEISFIHDAKTDLQKKELFAKVRAGQVRVLLGSTQRMGAGTNAQKKLVALHHLDCPWRPSDLQQREGRIIRQGNENPEVDIYTYVTEQTFDSYLYQLVEGKQKFISQIMTSKSPVRSAEDVDEQALSYAEIKALATGNPMIKEKMQLDADVSKLKMLKGSHLSQRYALEDKIIRYFPKEMAESKERFEGYGSDIQTVKENTMPNKDGFSSMTLFGKTYAEKKEAGSELLSCCHNLLSPEATIIGSYRGLDLELSFESFSQEYRLSMVGRLRHTVSLGTDIYGNLQRMDNLLESLPVKQETTKNHWEDVQKQLATAKAEVQQPFVREEELKSKTARLEELNALLNMDNKAPAEPEQAEKTKEQELER